jgi:hypothetical protein
MRSTSYGFGGALGAVFAFEIDHQPVVFFGVLPRQEEKGDAFVGEAMLRVVAGGDGFAFFRFGTGREFGIRLIGCDLGLRRHGYRKIL